MSTIDIVCVIIIILAVVSFWFSQPLFAAFLLVCGVVGIIQAHSKKNKKDSG
jgi:hypothetical protein